MTGSGIESDFVLPDSLSYRIIAHCQLSTRILAQTVVFFAQLAYRRIHLRLFAPQTIPEALPLDSAKGSSTLWTPIRAIQLVTLSCCFRVLIGERRKGRCPWTPPKGLRPSGLPFARLSCVHLHTVPACLLGEPKGRCPLTPQGTSSLDPSARLGCAHLHTVSACLLGKPLTQKSRPCLQGQPF